MDEEKHIFFCFLGIFLRDLGEWADIGTMSTIYQGHSSLTTPKGVKKKPPRHHTMVKTSTIRWAKRSSRGTKRR